MGAGPYHRPGAPQRTGQAEMVDAVGGEAAFVEDVEPILPHRRIERIDRVDIDCDARIEQRAHVALEERRHPRRILAGEYGQSHQ